MGGNPFETPFGHRIETTLLALCTLMTSVVPLLEASKLLIRCHGDSGEKTHILYVLGAQLCYCYFLHVLRVGNNEMEPVVQFNKIYIYWRILSDQLVILICSRGRTTRFQIKCIARPGSTIYTDILFYPC